MDSLIASRMGVDASLGVEWAELSSLPACTTDELNRVEAALALHLCCDPGRCTWLRSQPFLRLRMTALYFPRLCAGAPLSLYHQGLRVTLLDGRVAIARQDPSQGSFLAALEEIAVEDAAQPKRRPAGPKRPRLSYA